MPVSILLLCILALAAVPSLNAAAPPAKGYYISCGSTEAETINGIKWIPDDAFIKTGNVSKIKTPGIMPILSSVRSFSDTSKNKYCFDIRVVRNTRYLVRTTYYYGSFDGGKEPPVFDQIIEGTKWSTVDTTENYANGLSSYYEIIVQSRRNGIAVCLARNDRTTSDPFISALEVITLPGSMYNATDFKNHALSTVARHGFGHGEFISYPDDQFNRYWMPMTDPTRLTVECVSNQTSTELWNVPPGAALGTGFTESKGKDLVLGWPPMDLPPASYYVALYFQDNRSPSPKAWRVFDVKVNNQTFYDALNVSTTAVMVYSKQWPLSGRTEIRLTPAADMDKGPVINAGEVLQVVPLGPQTFPREANAMWKLARGFENPPSDWVGDPCLPKGHSWTGVTCTVLNSNFHRISSLNLANLGISGNLSSSLGRLTAIEKIDLSNNKLSGPIPDIKLLDDLVSLNLESNSLSGPIPPSVAELPKLKELYLKNNKLDGKVPDELKKKPGVDISV